MARKRESKWIERSSCLSQTNITELERKACGEIDTHTHNWYKLKSLSWVILSLERIREERVNEIESLRHRWRQLLPLHASPLSCHWYGERVGQSSLWVLQLPVLVLLSRTKSSPLKYLWWCSYIIRSQRGYLFPSLPSFLPHSSLCHFFPWGYQVTWYTWSTLSLPLVMKVVCAVNGLWTFSHEHIFECREREKIVMWKSSLSLLADDQRSLFVNNDGLQSSDWTSNLLPQPIQHSLNNNRSSQKLNYFVHPHQPNTLRELLNLMRPRSHVLPEWNVCSVVNSLSSCPSVSGTKIVQAGNHP